MKTLRVLEVIRQGDVGGGESHLIDLVTGFDRRRVEPVVLAFTQGRMIDTLRAAGFTCHVIETRRPFDPHIQKDIRQLIRQEGIQMIHAHGSRAASNIFWLAYRMRLPLIYTVHGWSFHQDQSPLTYRLRAWSEKLICAFCSRIICVSESNRISGTEAFGLKPRHTSVIENGINLQRFNPDAQFADVRQQLGIGKDEFVVGLIARITLQKNPIAFVKSIEKAHRKEPRIRGLIVGDGDMKDEMIAYIYEHKIEDLFYLSPFRTDIPDVLHAIDVYCLPSLWEGLSIALIEAMAMRKPVVVTPTDGTREIIRDNKDGRIVNFDEPGELADAYIYYLRHPEKMRAYGESARETVVQRFDNRRVAKQVEEIYLENR
jgi:glycosyltransferase involved in cell wall biosynthesis